MNAKLEVATESPSFVAWQEINLIFSAIKKHPFNQEIINGSLDEKKFIYFLEQDYLFLENLSKCFTLLSSIKSAQEFSKIFLEQSIGAKSAKEKIIDSFLKPYTSLQGEVSISIECSNFSHYLLQTCESDSIELAIAAILPCYWIYHELGKYISEEAVQDNKFNKWIATYSRKKFSASVSKLIFIFSYLFIKSDKALQSRMYQGFYKSSVMEWRFLEDAYNLGNYQG